MKPASTLTSQSGEIPPNRLLIKPGSFRPRRFTPMSFALLISIFLTSTLLSDALPTRAISQSQKEESIDETGRFIATGLLSLHFSIHLTHKSVLSEMTTPENGRTMLMVHKDLLESFQKLANWYLNQLKEKGKPTEDAELLIEAINEYLQIIEASAGWMATKKEELLNDFDLYSRRSNELFNSLLEIKERG